jgi:hypothetical protein
MNSGTLPTEIHEQIEVLHHIGYCDRHSDADMDVDIVVEVEPREAELCLKLLISIINFYYRNPGTTGS